MNNSQAEKRLRLIKKKLCVRCGANPPAPGAQICEACREYHRKYSAKQWRSKEGKRKRQNWLKNWQKANPDKCRERTKQYYHKAKKLVLDHYGRSCKCCGESQEAFLTIDHVDGGGKSERSNFYKRIVAQDFPPGLQTLCWNCNHAKFIYGVCPHRIS